MGIGKKRGSEDRDQKKADREARRQSRREARGKGKSGGGDSGTKADKNVSMNNSRRKDERVIRETVFETAGGILRKNKTFAVKRDGEDLYVGAYLKFDDIGGLSKKDMKDESKGSIINLINNGRIQNIYNSELAEEEAIVFIPDKDTVWHMDEYSILADGVEYELVLINLSDETIDHTDVRVNLSYLKKCHETGQNIRVKLGSVLEDAEVDFRRSEPDISIREDYGRDDDSGDGDYYSGDAEEPEDDDPPYEPEPPQEEPESYGGSYGDGGDGFSGFDGDDDDDDAGGEEDRGGGHEAPEPEQAVYADEEQSARALQRKFFNGDLDRELDSSALDQALDAFSLPIEIELRKEGSWLGDQVNAFIVHANAELDDLHQKNISIVQQEYLNTVGRAYAEHMTEAVSGLEADPRYMEIMETVKGIEESLAEKVEAERRSIIAEWEAKVEAAGESARISAIQSYKDRYGYQHDERLRNVEPEMRAGMMSSANKHIANLKTLRQREAQAELDKIDSDAIAAAVAHYSELHAQETELVQTFTEQIDALMAQQAENEMVRVKVLQDELSQSNRIETIQAEFRERAEVLKTDFDARMAALTADLDMARKRHEADLAAKNAEIEELRRKHTDEKRELNDHIKSLITDVERVTQSKKTELDIRTGELKAENEALQMHYDQLARSHRKTDTVIIAAAVLAALVLFFVGLLIGGRTGKADVPVQQPPAQTQGVQDSGQSQLPSDGTQAPDSGQTQTQTPTATPDAGQTQAPATSPEDDAWAAMQDPVITPPAN